MLEKIFKKSKKDVTNSLLLIGFIIIIVLVMAFSSNDNNTRKKDDVNVTELVNEINDNYTVDIAVMNSTETKNYNYSRDSKIELLDDGDYSDIAYLVYNNHYYKIDVNNFKLTKIKDIDRLKDPYTNMEIIKNVINKCELEYINDSNKECNINENIYFENYNNIYNTNYTSDKDMKINISFYKTSIYSIELDYSNIDKIINNNDDILKYKFIFSDIGKNDYSEMLKYYKKELK